MCWARPGKKGLPPSPAVPLAVFQGGQVLHPSPECVVSTEGLSGGAGLLG